MKSPCSCKVSGRKKSTNILKSTSQKQLLDNVLYEFDEMVLKTLAYILGTYTHLTIEATVLHIELIAAKSMRTIELIVEGDNLVLINIRNTNINSLRPLWPSIKMFICLVKVLRWFNSFHLYQPFWDDFLIILCTKRNILKVTISLYQPRFCWFQCPWLIQDIMHG